MTDENGQLRRELEATKLEKKDLENTMETRRQTSDEQLDRLRKGNCGLGTEIHRNRYRIRLIHSYIINYVKRAV